MPNLKLNPSYIAYSAGVSYPDDLFAEQRESIIADLTKCVGNTARTLRYWSINRIESSLDEILDAIVADPKECLRIASKKWYDDGLNDERFRRYAPRLVEGLVKDHEQCYNADIHWPTRKFRHFAKKITQGLLDDIKYVLKAGKE